MSITQKMCRVKDLPTQILAWLFVSLMFIGLPSHFPLLTMVIFDKLISFHYIICCNGNLKLFNTVGSEFWF